MEKQNSGNLSKGDIISFVAIVLLGITVFFGMNFSSLGDKVLSIIVAILLVVVMFVFVFLAAHAKAQNRNQSMWRKVEYGMLALYVLSIIPCYIYSAKFFDIYFSKTEITKLVQKDIEDINKVFNEYNRKCDSRISSYQTSLEAMLTYEQGRVKIAQLLDINPKDLTEANVKQASESFSSCLKGGSYKSLESDKRSLEQNVNSNFNNWNILFIPQYAQELGIAKGKYAEDLKVIYDKYKNDIEKNVPEFDTKSFNSESTITSTFSSSSGFSFLGLLAVLVLGCLGLVKYLLGEKRTVIEFEEGDSTAITSDGGFTF